MIGKIGGNQLSAQAVQHSQSHTVVQNEDPRAQSHSATELSRDARQTTGASTASQHSQSSYTPHQGGNSEPHTYERPAIKLPADESARPAAAENTRDTDQNAEENNTRSDQPQQKTHTVNGRELEEAEYRQVQELKHRDREVRQHEQAHLAAAGQHARGGPSFSFQQGPDGKRYAVGGEVQIDTSPVANDPQATIQKAQQIQAAASAPAEPSAQDRQVSAAAAQMAANARAELAQQQIEEQKQAAEKRESTQNEASAQASDSHGSQANREAADTYASTATISSSGTQTPRLDEHA